MTVVEAVAVAAMMTTVVGAVEENMEGTVMTTVIATATVVNVAMVGIDTKTGDTMTGGIKIYGWPYRSAKCLVCQVARPIARQLRILHVLRFSTYVFRGL